ncbi:MAG TPA: hypothetical protein VFO65_05685 [Acidimicrobiales bacterium]|nr:hypothetical protein [Acidimicrobiales bacterium]
MERFEVVDLTGLATSGDGVAWSTSPEGLHVNLVALGPRGEMAEHVNAEVDVVVVVVAGEATVTVEGRAHRLAGGSAGVVPRGARRAVAAGPGGARYLSIHRRRAPLGVRSPGAAG